MKPKTLKAHLKLLLKIADISPYDLKGITDDEAKIISGVHAALQNSLGDELEPLLTKCGLIYKG